MDSFGTIHIFTNNKNLGQYDQNAIPSQIMPCYSYPGNLINQNKIMSTSSSGTNYVLNEHEGVDQYGSFALPLDLMLHQSHPESLVNQNEILIELSC